MECGLAGGNYRQELGRKRWGRWRTKNKKSTEKKPNEQTLSKKIKNKKGKSMAAHLVNPTEERERRIPSVPLAEHCRAWRWGRSRKVLEESNRDTAGTGKSGGGKSAKKG